MGRVVVSVKGGTQINPAMVREIAGTVEAQRAQMGILVMMEPATRGILDAAAHSGTYIHETTGNKYPKVQVLSVPDLLNGAKVAMPTPFLPYLQAQRFVEDHPTLPGL